MKYLAKVYLTNLHPPLKDGPPFPPFNPPFKKGGPPFLEGGWMNVLSYPPLLRVDLSTLKKGYITLIKGGPPFLRVDDVRVNQRRVVKGWITLLKGGWC